ncbi:hypothetical protein [Methylobacterium radiotolerans]|uniref:hypothetical protein n=1 Tax=Methylobacterium radiotolerans TaxID=31998 RepID=UPI0009771435|nr:hypothetical protein [Methylobacterium radiotolerans]ONF49468.1 hypothetical protein RSM1_08800 [Methylobacterium radiotolerans]
MRQRGRSRVQILLAAATVWSAGILSAGAQSAAAPTPPPQLAPAQPTPAQAAPIQANTANPGTGQPAPAAPGCDATCVRANNELASQICAPRIEAQAPTDFEWVSRPFAKIFQQAEAPEGGATVVRYRGDSIRFLSPAKEWVRVTYECGFDAAKRSVEYVRVRLGRLDKADAPAQPAQQVRPNVPTPQPMAPQAQQQAARPGTAPPRKLLPSEPSEIEVRQVNPRIRQAQP